MDYNQSSWGGNDINELSANFSQCKDQNMPSAEVTKAQPVSSCTSENKAWIDKPVTDQPKEYFTRLETTIDSALTCAVDSAESGGPMPPMLGPVDLHTSATVHMEYYSRPKNSSSSYVVDNTFQAKSGSNSSYKSLEGEHVGKKQSQSQSFNSGFSQSHASDIRNDVAGSANAPVVPDIMAGLGPQPRYAMIHKNENENETIQNTVSLKGGLSHLAPLRTRGGFNRQGRYSTHQFDAAQHLQPDDVRVQGIQNSAHGRPNPELTETAERDIQDDMQVNIQDAQSNSNQVALPEVHSEMDSGINPRMLFHTRQSMHDSRSLYHEYSPAVNNFNHPPIATHLNNEAFFEACGHAVYSGMTDSTGLATPNSFQELLDSTHGVQPFSSHVEVPLSSLPLPSPPIEDDEQIVKQPFSDLSLEYESDFESYGDDNNEFSECENQAGLSREPISAIARYFGGATDEHRLDLTLKPHDITYPLGIEEYISNDDGFYDANLTSHLHMVRLRCFSTQFPICEPKKPAVLSKINIFPPVPEFQLLDDNLRPINGQYVGAWLQQAVYACIEPRNRWKLVETGELQNALMYNSNTQNLEDTLALLTLIRLIASSPYEVPNIEFVALQMYNFIQRLLREPNLDFSCFLTHNKVTCIPEDKNRAFITYFAAHTLPCTATPLMSTAGTQIEKAQLNRHVSMVYDLCSTIYGPELIDGDTFAESLPEYLGKYYKNFTVHDMAIEAFIDLGKSNVFYSLYTTTVREKWASLINPYLNLQCNEFNMRFIHLHIACRNAYLDIPSLERNDLDVMKECYTQLDHTLRLIRRRSTRKADCPSSVPVKFATLCARLLAMIFQSSEIDYPLSLCVDGVFRRPALARNLMRYLIAVPSYKGVLNDMNHALLYDSVWNVIYSMKYSLEGFLNLFMEYISDKSLPLEFRGQMGMVLGHSISQTRHEFSQRKVFFLYELLKVYAWYSESETIRQRREEVANMVSRVLNGFNITVPDIDDPSHIPERSKKILFAPYRYSDGHVDFACWKTRQDKDDEEHYLCVQSMLFDKDIIKPCRSRLRNASIRKARKRKVR